MHTRFMIVTALVLLACAGISFLVLLPSYFVISNDAVSPLSAPAANLTAESASSTATLARAKSLLGTLAPLIAATTSPTEAIASALALRPAGVSVDEITYIAGATSSLMIVGSAASNGDISAYRLALGTDPLFTSVMVPVGALIGTDGGRFSITLSGQF